MTTGGMTPAAGLKAEAGDRMDAFLAQWAARPTTKNLWLVALGIALLVSGMFMLGREPTSGWDFQLILAGILLISPVHHKENGQ
ncbi:hypothetical protein [Arthrobacter sp. StoSoilB22]|uniref:hypothetical protein n=1 Tax=Arthrobacter sp. StoSoilB22 TaxID=2830996 RepID=UPI001CC64C0F|nr:hypothetical protein [Arthrobacter sp. StoSoilB22]BCW64213.1 hypothetical protein StoSoilB22_31860 [Arthrobacter sp. StoSoilB22]